MVRSRLGLKALGLCALVVGLMAIGASAAQASEWYYMSGGTLTAVGGTAPTVEGSLENNTGSLLFTTKGGTAVKIECTAVTLKNFKLVAGGKTTEGTVKFSGCETYLNGVPSSKCTPETAGVKLVVESKKLLALIALHENVTVALVEPETGTKLAEIELGVSCAIGEVIPVEGHLVLEECKGAFPAHLAVHLFQEHKTLHLLKALGQPATLDGSANIILNTGVTWAALHF